MFRSFLLVLVAVFFFPVSAPAETIWSYYPLGLQTERHEIITSCTLNLCFYDPDTQTFSPEILNETVTAASQGQTYTAKAQTNLNFDDFLSRVLSTENSSELVCVRLITNNGTDLSTGTVKSIVFNGSPDLTNYDITAVSLTLDEFILDTPGSDIWHDGIDTYLSEAITISFMGVPEPSALVMLLSIAGFSGILLTLRHHVGRIHSRL